MKNELFQELLASVREGGAILRGEQEPARRVEIEAPDVSRLRRESGFSQREFATLMGISTGTLRNWEQGRRQPRGAARVLLSVASRHPEAVWDVVKSPHAAPPKKEEKPRDLASAAKSPG
jgi:putative transcriptional regulator